MKSFFALISFICFLSAIAQAQSDGTIIYARWSQNKIVIAADSRQAGSSSYSDTGCKISAFGNKLIFAASGRSKPAGEVFWNTYTVAANDFYRITNEGTADHLAQRVADAWGRDVKIKFERLGNDALSGAEDNTVALGFFADFEKDGTLLMAVSAVTYEENFIHPNISAKTDIIRPSDGNGYFMGRGAIVSEIQAAKTPRGIKWSKEIANKAGIEEQAIAYVDLTIKNLPDTKTDSSGKKFSVVGPPIAVAQLVRRKGIDWIAKGKCAP